MTELLILTKKNTRMLMQWIEDNKNNTDSFLLFKLNEKSWRIYGHYNNLFKDDGIPVTNFLLKLYLNEINEDNYANFQRDKIFLHIISTYANNVHQSN